MSFIVLRTKSASSSQIENLTVGARQLALAEIDQSTSDNARTAAADLRTVKAALTLADRLDEWAILRMHVELISRQRGWEEHAGRYRELTAFRDGDARPIVEQFSHAARYAATMGAMLVDGSAGELDRVCEALAGLRPQAVAWRVVPHLVVDSVINPCYLVERMDMHGASAQRALQQHPHALGTPTARGSVAGEGVGRLGRRLRAGSTTACRGRSRSGP